MPGFDYFDKAVKLLRELRDLKQDELGERIGLDAQQVGRYEKGTGRPTLDRFEALLDGLGVSLAEFGRFMEHLERLGREAGTAERQFELWTRADSEVREVDRAERLLYLTASGTLFEVDDPRLVQWLNDTLGLAAGNPRALVTLTPPPPRFRPERRRKKP